MEHIIEELWDPLVTTVTKHYINLLYGIASLTPEADFSSIRDSYKRYDAVCEILSHGKSAERLMSRCLIYLKSHSNLLRHAVGVVTKDRTLTIRDFQLAAKAFEDLEVALCEAEHFDFLQVVRTYSTEYVEHFTNRGINLRSSKRQPTPKKITPPIPKVDDSHIEGEPPKYKDIYWYRVNGWLDFLRTKQIMFVKGLHQYKPCRIDRFNSTNTRCEFEDGYHSISNHHLLTWL